MLERDLKATEEGSGVMLFQVLKGLLMILPQSPCHRILRDRLVSVSRFRQSTMSVPTKKAPVEKRSKKAFADTKSFVERALAVRNLHCTATWHDIRRESLEVPKYAEATLLDDGATRRAWLGYASKQEQLDAEKAFQDGNKHRAHIEELDHNYYELPVGSRNDS
jgi:hypothetical protein